MQFQPVNAVTISVRKSMTTAKIKYVFEQQFNLCKVSNVTFGKLKSGFKKAHVIVTDWKQHPANSYSAIIIEDIFKYRYTQLSYEDNRYWNIEVDEKHNLMNQCEILKCRVTELEQKLFKYENNDAVLNAKKRTTAINGYKKNTSLDVNISLFKQHCANNIDPTVRDTWNQSQTDYPFTDPQIEHWWNEWNKEQNEVYSDEASCVYKPEALCNIQNEDSSDDSTIVDESFSESQKDEYVLVDNYTQILPPPPSPVPPPPPSNIAQDTTQSRRVTRSMARKV